MREDRFKKYLGCILGLAIGDALGAPVEFDDYIEIQNKYGKKGITDLEPWSDFPAGSYTDDTQMSIATANGIMKSLENSISDEDLIIKNIYHEYLEWLELQKNPSEYRAPGNTCISALESGEMGSLDRILNNSKGCGGVMRSAPIGLSLKLRNHFNIGMLSAAITHSHPSGFLPAGFLSLLIRKLMENSPLHIAIQECIVILKSYDSHEETLEAIDEALELATTNIDCPEAIHQIGGGWVGQEALAISLYCSLKHPNDFMEGVLASVNHSGDSDSTGCITGAILGTKLGADAIPAHWIPNIENKDLLIKIAQSLHDLSKY